jgi:hypothetical protein
MALCLDILGSHGGALSVTEKELTGYVRDLAAVFRWKRYHTWRSQHSPAGFPDEVLVRPPRLIFAELKVGRFGLVKHEPTIEQKEWLCLLALTGVEVYIWRDTMLEEIAEILR